MDPNCKIYYKTALKLLLPVFPAPEISGFKLIFGQSIYYFYGYITSFNLDSSCTISTDKYLTNRVLNAWGIPVPNSTTINVGEFNRELLAERVSFFKFPVVLKPGYGTAKGEGVLCKIPDVDTLYNDASELIQNGYQYLAIEEFHGGMQSYRVLMFNKKIMAITRREPSKIIGDGVLTIEGLVSQKNKVRQETVGYYAPIIFDKEVLYKLKEQNYSLKTILKKDETLYLNYTSNANRGGTTHHISTKICAENVRLMKLIVTCLNLNFAGIDVECTTLDKPIIKNGGVIIEVNAYPSVRMHEDSALKHKVNVTSKMMRTFIYRHPFHYTSYILKIALRQIEQKNHLFAILIALFIYCIGYFILF